MTRIHPPDIALQLLGVNEDFLPKGDINRAKFLYDLIPQEDHRYQWSQDLAQGLLILALAGFLAWHMPAYKEILLSIGGVLACFGPIKTYRRTVTTQNLKKSYHDWIHRLALNARDHPYGQ